MANFRQAFVLQLDRSTRLPLFLEIARAISADICRGRLRPGDPLPGTRTLAQSLGVSRVTVLKAYDALASEGWISVQPTRGAFVCRTLPEGLQQVRPAARSGISSPCYELPEGPPVERSPEHLRDVLVFGGSSPDPRLLNVDPLARAYRRVLRTGQGRLLGYSGPEGHPRLRAAVAEMLSANRGISARADNVFITRGSQMALGLTARALVRPGDTIAVESIGYRHAWESFRLAGATVIPVPVDHDGLDVDPLDRLADRQKVSAVYVTPHHQFPTTVTLAAARRLRLLEIAEARRMAIIEDDYDHEFHFDGRPLLPLASLDRAGVVIYIGTFSKVLAPGVRIGFVVGPEGLLQRLGAYREFVDMQGDHTVEAAVAELLEEQEIQRHIRRVRRTYRGRRDLLATLLRDTFGDALEFNVPAGGIALWVRARPPLDVETWCVRAHARGAAFQTARSFTFDGRTRPFVRLGYASLDERELRRGVARLRDAAIGARS